jgi:hypothetical protein
LDDRRLAISSVGVERAVSVPVVVVVPPPLVLLL